MIHLSNFSVRVIAKYVVTSELEPRTATCGRAILQGNSHLVKRRSPPNAGKARPKHNGESFPDAQDEEEATRKTNDLICCFIWSRILRPFFRSLVLM